MPMFPEERAWVAHCMAGGCASVATSFVYTPSECVKQRCQVSGAMTAWQATRGIVAEGGVRAVQGMDRGAMPKHTTVGDQVFRL